MHSGLMRILHLITMVWRWANDYISKCASFHHMESRVQQHLEQIWELRAAFTLPRMHLPPFLSFVWLHPSHLLQVSVWKYLPLRPNVGPTCKLPGLLSSGLPEHFASCITIACVHAGLHIGHDLLEGKGRFLCTVCSFPGPRGWPSCSRGEQMQVRYLLLHGKPSTMTQQK